MRARVEARYANRRVDVMVRLMAMLRPVNDIAL